MVYLPDNVNFKCGIYRIKNLRNGKFYVGSTKNAVARKAEHFKDLRKGRHHSTYLQNAWDAENDPTAFEFQIFIYCKKDDLLKLEQKCIDFMNPVYNMSKIAGRIEYTPDVIDKMRRVRLAFLSSAEGLKFRQEAKDRTLDWLNSMEGKAWSASNREAHSERMHNYWASSRSEFHRQNLSEEMSGEKNPSSQTSVRLLRREQLRSNNPSKNPAFSEAHSATMTAIFGNTVKREKYLFHWWWQANARDKSYWGA